MGVAVLEAMLAALVVADYSQPQLMAMALTVVLVPMGDLVVLMVAIAVGLVAAAAETIVDTGGLVVVVELA